MATVSTVYSLVSTSGDQWDGYFVKPYTSRKTVYHRLLAAVFDGCRVDMYGLDWDERFRRALEITDSEVVKCNIDGYDHEIMRVVLRIRCRQLQHARHLL
jgi:hypothetical protein